MHSAVARLAAFAALLALANCGQSPAPAPAAETPAAQEAGAAPPNMAPLAYIVSQHSPLLDADARTAISQDFNGAPLSGARRLRQINAENVRCGAAPELGTAAECALTFGPGQVVALTGEDATALFSALGVAGAQEAMEAKQITRELNALRCTVDDAVAQDTPATGDEIAGFSCQFTQPS